VNADTLRLLSTYVIAAIVIAGSYLLLVIPTPDISSDAKLALVTANTGLVLGFIFNRESTTAGQRAAERAVSLGANTAAPANQMTVTAP
jgi:hypothetical protein